MPQAEFELTILVSKLSQNVRSSALACKGDGCKAESSGISGSDGVESEVDVLLRCCTCSLIFIDGCFTGVYYLHHQGDEVSDKVLEAVRNSETLVSVYRTASCNITEDSCV